MEIKAIIFDLDGVIVNTDKYHFYAWTKMAKEEDIYFNEAINNELRGVSRLESLEIILKYANKNYSLEEKTRFAALKNSYYLNELKKLTKADILENAELMLQHFKNKGYLLALASSSKNAKIILKRLALTKYFNVVVDGNEIKKAKPDPEIFLLAAKKLKIEPSACVVIEDATAGIEAAVKASMQAIAFGDAVKTNFKHKKIVNLIELKDIL